MNYLDSTDWGIGYGEEGCQIMIVPIPNRLGLTSKFSYSIGSKVVSKHDFYCKIIQKHGYTREFAAQMLGKDD